MNQTQPVKASPRRRRRWIPTATAAGAGGTALVIWLEELIFLAAELFSVIFLPILAGMIYLFNHLVFKSAMPRRSDLLNLKDKVGGTLNDHS
jgi:hypothetical protein